jgi:hypothetical protein
MHSILLALLLAARIRDNSFLVEEAYNQETGVVQNIFSFTRVPGAWQWAFTQEWPVLGQRHQLSYTVPLDKEPGAPARLGDVALNYRYQLLGGGEGSRLACAPRLSLLQSPEGGRPWVQLMVPFSLPLGERLITHWNLGVSTTRAVTLGQSFIFTAMPALEFMLEGLATGTLDSIDSYTVSPGVRVALDLPGEVQIVPGVAVPIDQQGRVGALLYLSIEHPFGGAVK